MKIQYMVDCNMATGQMSGSPNSTKTARLYINKKAQIKIVPSRTGTNFNNYHKLIR